MHIAKINEKLIITYATIKICALHIQGHSLSFDHDRTRFVHGLVLKRKDRFSLLLRETSHKADFYIQFSQSDCETRNISHDLPTDWRSAERAAAQRREERENRPFFGRKQPDHVFKLSRRHALGKHTRKQSQTKQLTATALGVIALSSSHQLTCSANTHTRTAVERRTH